MVFRLHEQNTVMKTALSSKTTKAFMRPPEQYGSEFVRQRIHLASLDQQIFTAYFLCARVLEFSDSRR